MSYIQEVIAVVADGAHQLVPTGGAVSPAEQSEIDKLNAEVNEIKAELALQPEYFLRWGLSTGALYAEEVQVNN